MKRTMLGVLGALLVSGCGSVGESSGLELATMSQGPQSQPAMAEPAAFMDYWMRFSSPIEATLEFEEWDQEQSGQLSLGEFVAGELRFRQRLANRNLSVREKASASLTVTRLFGDLDTNGDHHLSMLEFSGFHPAPRQLP